MRRKQLFAIILAGALAAGSAPAAVFAAESDMAAMSEEGTGDAGFEEAGSEDGSSDAESIPFVQYLHEATGIDVDFTIASSDGGQRTEQFNILIASNEYPDIMESNWAGFKGGAQGAIDQKS